MNNAPIEADSAKAILKTYHQVHDTAKENHPAPSKLDEKNKKLEDELFSLKEKYMLLQRELINRDKRLAHLNRQLVDKTTHAARLQEDFENAIYHLTKKEGSK